MSKNTPPGTIILLFIRSSEEDATEKNISGGKKLFDALNEYFLQQIKEAGLPFLLVNSDNQKGSSFGERFSIAIKSAFDKGYENILAIGNDSPRLTNELLFDAVKQLEENKAIIGPSVDGGFYLLGLNRSNFDLETFAKLSWQTPKIIREIEKILHAQNRKHVLFPTLFDIDCLYDLKIFINQDNPCSKKLYKIAKGIFDTTLSKYLFVDLIDH